MKRNSEVRHVLSVSVPNEANYHLQIMQPLFDSLGFPKDIQSRWREFRLENFDKRRAKAPIFADYLTVIEGIPVLLTECKPRSEQFDQAVREAQQYAEHFSPIEKGEILTPRGWKAPFVLVAAGSQARCYRLVHHKHLPIVVWEPLEGLLEYDDIKREAERFGRQLGRDGLARVLKPDPRRILAIQSVLRQFYDDLWTALKGTGMTDERIMRFNEVLQALAAQGGSKASGVVQGFPWPQARRRRVLRVLSGHAGSFQPGDLPGPAAAVAYRGFIGEQFDGTSSALSVSLRRASRAKVKEWDTGRYFTSDEIIRPMVRLLGINGKDRVIDPACGSGGFLIAALARMAPSGCSRRDILRMLQHNLVGLDIDPCCVSIARTLLALSDPGFGTALSVHQHNGLYAECRTGDEKDLAGVVTEGDFDVVVSNPPGNMRYSGTNPGFVARLFPLKKSLADYELFVQRALSLAKRDGGRIGLVLPESFVTNEKAGGLRALVRKRAELVAIVSLPRVFWSNPARMVVVYLRTFAHARKSVPICLGAVSGGTNGESESLSAMLDHAVDHILQSGS